MVTSFPAPPPRGQCHQAACTLLTSAGFPMFTIKKYLFPLALPHCALTAPLTCFCLFLHPALPCGFLLWVIHSQPLPVLMELTQAMCRLFYHGYTTMARSLLKWRKHLSIFWPQISDFFLFQPCSASFQLLYFVSCVYVRLARFLRLLKTVNDSPNN